MYLIRANESFLFDSFERPFISAVLGPRRVGKTTLVNHYIKQHPERKWVLLNMDQRHERLRAANAELGVMIEEIALQPLKGKEKIWVLIDEAQKCPELFDQIKFIYDHYKGQDRIKFILTGSARLDLHQFTSESLAGRVDLLHLREFNLREMTNLLHRAELPRQTAFEIIFDSADEQAFQDLYFILRPFNKLFTEALQTHAIWGGLPEVLQEETEAYRWKYLADYLQTYLEKDIRAIDSIGDLALYQNLMKICAEQTGSLRDDKKIIDALHCARNTVDKYRGYLQATLQYMEIYPYINSSIKRLVKSPKAYITNNGLVSYLTGIDRLSILQTTGLLGHRFENWFLNELQTWLDTIPKSRMIYFWRTAGGTEVDFVVTVGAKIVPFEVTYSTHIQANKVKHLKAFMHSEPKASLGVYIYMGDYQYDKENKILFLPAWMI